MPCMIPIMLLSPSVSKSRKKRMDQKTDPGINDMVSMKATSTKLEPDLTC